MNENEELDHLKRRLTWEGGGPLAELSSRMTDALTERGGELASWVREMAMDRPLISLLMAFQIGAAPCEALIFCLVRRICGQRWARAVCQVRDTARFP
jgi:hypothetical protein